MTTAIVKLHPPPSSGPTSTPADYSPPSVEWMTGTWHVTHSTLPMWKSSRNVTISYKPLEHIENGMRQLEDIVRYQSLSSDKVKTILGVDTYSARIPGAWDWRGKGWLKLITSHWQILGYGELEGGNRWVVTFFAKTIFSAAGVDIYSMAKDGLPAEVIEAIKNDLYAMNDPLLKVFAEEMFEVQQD